MRIPHRARTLAAGAVLSGAVLLGASVGGMASVDRTLSAATESPPPPAAQSLHVVYDGRDTTATRDCDERGQRRDGARQRL